MGAWTEVMVANHPCEVFEPVRRHEHGFVILYLHGFDHQRLRDQPRLIEQFEQWGLPVMAPYGGRCWWVSKRCPDFDPSRTPEQHVMDHVLPAIAERWGAEPPRIGLFGITMGGQGALRFAYKFPNRFPVVAAIAPTIDYQLRYDDDPMLQVLYADPEAARQDTALLHIHPLNWPRNQFFCCDPGDRTSWNGGDRLRMKLYSLGVPHECDLESSTGGPELDYVNAMAERAVKFVVDRLEQERRRLAQA